MDDTVEDMLVGREALVEKSPIGALSGTEDARRIGRRIESALIGISVEG